MHRKTILIIDDEPEVLSLIQDRIESHPFRCITAGDPVIGLQKAVQLKPNLILLDLMLPKMSGIGFLRLIKGNPLTTNIPVIILTALRDEEIARETMGLGAAGYLTKMCSTQELISMIQNYAS